MTNRIILWVRSSNALSKRIGDLRLLQSAVNNTHGWYPSAAMQHGDE